MTAPLKAARVRIALATLAFVAMSWALPALAQPGGPGQGGLGQPGGALPQQPTQQGGKEGPLTHAASGGETPAQLPTEEAELPEDPNKVPEQLDGVLESDYDEDALAAADANAEADRVFYGLYYGETKGKYSFKTILPPLWMEHTQGEDRTSVFGINYLNRRSPDVDWDIFFPIFWKLRHKQTYTTVVGPVMHREGPTGHDNWLAPIFFEGSGEDGHEYLHLPPLLTFHTRTARNGFSMAGPAFCKWKGGARCDNRTTDEIDMGIAPFYFYGRDARSEYEVIPPLLHYYSYEEKGDEELDVWGPLWMESSRKGGVFNVLPLFWHNWEGEFSSNTTLFPLFHYGYKGNARTIATPLFVDHIDEEGAHTFATPIYARHRGRTEVDMVTPLFWQYRDPDIQLERTMMFPFFYRNVSNRSNDVVVFPFYGQFHRYGISREWWVTPLFRHQKSLTGWETDIMPFFFAGRENNSTHLVVAPVLWDFASPSSRSTVVFPFFWRFSDRKGVAQLVGNTYYAEEETAGGNDWELHIFPFFSYGESPQGHWWNVFYGLAGYTRDGTMSKMRVAYIPFKLSE
jgi:hypothetical protein